MLSAQPLVSNYVSTPPPHIAGRGKVTVHCGVELTVPSVRAVGKVKIERYIYN